jgi:ribose 5-phosphate isomerase B
VRVAIGSDHAGFALKETIKALLDGLKVPYEDFGTTSPAPVDYPDVAETVSRAVVGGRANLGILICGTGIGMSIAANKIAGVRAAAVCDEAAARLSRAHNDANIMTLAAGTVRAFLSTGFEGGRHGRRLEKIARLERKDA